MSPSIVLRRLAIVAAVFAASVPFSASAQTADETDRAEKLFAEAIALVKEGHYTDACPKFEESQHLDPGLGTQFNLALCFEKVGRLGSAWRSFVTVKRLAHESGKKGREEAALQKMEELRARVSHLVLTAPDADVTLKVDGQQVDREAWGFYAVDPGDHTVEATAPTKKSWQAVVTVAAATDSAGTEVGVDVPPLVATAQTHEVTVTKETSNAKRTIGFAVGGVGIVGIAVAAVTGIAVLNDHAIAESRCTGGLPPACRDQGARDAVSTGKTLLVVNAVAWGMGIVGLGMGSFLVLTSGTKKPATAQLAPLVGRDLGGMSMVGRF